MSLPDTMRALRVHALGEPPRLDRLPLPVPAPGEVLVQVEAAVIGRHDLSVASGSLPLQQPLPYVPGLEGAGRVAEVGADVDGLAPGVRVRVVGLGTARPGTWAEYVAAPAAAVTPVPESLAPALAAACGSSANTAWVATFELGALGPDESLGVTGATGAVGSLVLQLAARDGGRRIVAWTRTPERVHAATEVLRDEEDAAEPVDLLIDTVGGPRLQGRLRSVRPGGRAVLLGYTAGEQVSIDLPSLMFADVALLPLNMRRRRVPPEVTAGLIEDVAAGRLTLAVEVVSAGEVEHAIDRLRAGTAAGRIVVAWRDDAA